MSFEVRKKKNPGMIVVRVLCVLMIAAIVWFINWDLMRDALRQEGLDIIFMGFVGIFLLFFVGSFYVQRRPRIEVNGQHIAIYPLWRPSKKITLREITSRKAEGDTSGEQLDAAIGGMLLGGMPAYALQQRYSDALQSPKEMSYTYYSGDTKLITVSTKGMENVERFDNMVVDKLEGKPLPGAGVKMTAEEVEPAEKTKLPLIFAGLAGVVCLVAVIVIVLIPRTGTRSPDLLAGTSWIAANDGSQWVFREDQTFHWYQTKGETDDNYFAGTYEFHIGQDALDYLTTELSRYAVTEREMRDVISRVPEYTVDNFVCFSCVNQSFMLNGQEQLSEENVSSYFGFLLLDGTYLDIANMTTGTYYGFMKE
ncbi:MAG: YueC family protein [Clostridiales bacterium]|nr:YueC family protein [Clostridiales bacterium]